MTSLYYQLCSAKPDAAIDWPAIEAAFEWFHALKACPQDPEFHAEGNVKIHTKMVAEAIVSDPVWAALTPEDRQIGLWAALLHDVAKPKCTKVCDDGRIQSPGHSRRGQIMARRILWEMGAPFADRETICHLITHHQIPLYFFEREKPERRIHLISWQTRCDLLALLARADIRGRICKDANRLLDNVALFASFARDEACWASPRAFATNETRFEYFRKADRYADYEAYDDRWGGVTVMSGMPASGKDTWIARYGNGRPVISLDELRLELGIEAADSQGPVVAHAREQAKVYLRRHEPFIWNGTNLSRERRLGLIDLFADYKARVTIVYVETAPAEALRRNAARPNPVPKSAIERMFDHWEVPDLTECHAFHRVAT
jgi:predicted kinase